MSTLSYNISTSQLGSLHDVALAEPPRAEPAEAVAQPAPPAEALTARSCIAPMLERARLCCERTAEAAARATLESVTVAELEALCTAYSREVPSTEVYNVLEERVRAALGDSARLHVRVANFYEMLPCMMRMEPRSWIVHARFLQAAARAGGAPPADDPGPRARFRFQLLTRTQYRDTSDRLYDKIVEHVAEGAALDLARLVVFRCTYEALGAPHSQCLPQGIVDGVLVRCALARELLALAAGDPAVPHAAALDAKLALCLVALTEARLRDLCGAVHPGFADARSCLPAADRRPEALAAARCAIEAYERAHSLYRSFSEAHAYRASRRFSEPRSVWEDSVYHLVARAFMRMHVLRYAYNRSLMTNAALAAPHARLAVLAQLCQDAMFMIYSYAAFVRDKPRLAAALVAGRSVPAAVRASEQDARKRRAASEQPRAEQAAYDESRAPDQAASQRKLRAKLAQWRDSAVRVASFLAERESPVVELARACAAAREAPGGPLAPPAEPPFSDADSVAGARFSFDVLDSAAAFAVYRLRPLEEDLESGAVRLASFAIDHDVRVVKRSFNVQHSRYVRADLEAGGGDDERPGGAYAVWQAQPSARAPAALDEEAAFDVARRTDWSALDAQRASLGVEERTALDETLQPYPAISIAGVLRATAAIVSAYATSLESRAAAERGGVFAAGPGAGWALAPESGHEPEADLRALREAFEQRFSWREGAAAAVAGGSKAGMKR
jgi:hypothetical protein